MSLWPGSSLEDFIKYIHPKLTSKESTRRLLDHYEPFRKTIERKLSLYTEDYGSFPMYLADQIWPNVPDFSTGRVQK